MTKLHCNNKRYMIQYLPGAYNLDKNVFVRKVTMQISM